MLKFLKVTALGCSLVVGTSASAAAQDGANPEMVNKIRKTATAIGNAYVCAKSENRDVFREEAHHLFDLILQDVGSDLAFVYAISMGHGTGQTKGNLDCPALLKQWEGLREDYKLRAEK